MIDVPDSGLLIKLEILFNDSTTIHHYQDIQVSSERYISIYLFFVDCICLAFSVRQN